MGAVLTVIATTIAGYLIARAGEFANYGAFMISGGGQLTPLELLYSLIGFVIGAVVAGAVFGAIATLYDIRDSLRIIVGMRLDALPVAARDRREPRLE